jgi:hypothetical protein
VRPRDLAGFRPVGENSPAPLLSVPVAGGKYEVVQDHNGLLRALRHGEPWRDLGGDGLVLALAQEVAALRENAVDALARAGHAVVPCALPEEVLGRAAIEGVFETGNPRHGWDVLVARTRLGPGAAVPRVIVLTGAEVQSGLDRVRWAEGLIRQLPADHDGRNSWLENYGLPVDADGCHTLPDGSCAVPGPCLHSPPGEPVEGPELYWSADGEEFNAGSLDELLDSLDAPEAGRVVYHGEREDRSGGHYLSLGGVLEQMNEAAWNEHGDRVGDWPTRVPHLARAELSALLGPWLERWCRPPFYRVRNIQQYELTAGDVAGRG